MTWFLVAGAAIGASVSAGSAAAKGQKGWGIGKAALMGGAMGAASAGAGGALAGGAGAAGGLGGEAGSLAGGLGGTGEFATGATLSDMAGSGLGGATGAAGGSAAGATGAGTSAAGSGLSPESMAALKNIDPNKLLGSMMPNGQQKPPAPPTANPEETPRTGGYTPTAAAFIKRRQGYE